ncbi:MAG: hypothetical protein ACAH95_09155 [Fimbriimonas sp.]
MKERNNQTDKLYRVRGDSMLFNDRVFRKDELVSAAVVGKQLLVLVENGHLEPVDTEEDGTFRERLTLSVSRLLGRAERVR